MRGIVLKAFGGNDRLEYRRDLTDPHPAPGEVLIRVKAAAAAVWDILVRKGTFPGIQQPPFTPGFEGAGKIEAVGSAVSGFAVGDDVYGYWQNLPHGAWAELIVVPAEQVAPMPKITYDEAAAVPVAAITAWQGLHEALQIAEGDTVLITGAAGGVGTMAVQIAAAAGAYVVATAGSENREYVRKLGARAVVDYQRPDAFDALLAANNGTPYAKALDCVNGSYAKSFTQPVVADGGRIAYLTGPFFEGERRITATFIASEPGRKRLEKITGLIDAGKIEVNIDQSFALPDIADALDYVGAGHVRGKVVISIE